nr:non-ribosomal peptide synthetase [Paenibacillus arenosi]
MPKSIEHVIRLYVGDEHQSPIPAGANLVDRFETEVVRNPKRIAVWGEGVTLTYRELHLRSDHLAYEIQRRGVMPGSIVGITADRSVSVITGMLGIIKAGCAYMPIDPAWPAKRVQDILESSKASLVVKCASDLLVGPDIDVIDMSAPFPKMEAVYESPIIKGDHLAYVLYTSGSTGTPKGVMIEHRNVLNLIQGLQAQVYHEHVCSKIACVAPLYFDASVKQIFTSLLLGHSLYIVPNEVRLDGEALWKFYMEHEIEISDGTPMHIQMLTVAAIYRGYKEMSVKHFMIGGEAFPANVVRDFVRVCQPTSPKITNVYGPTECCVDTTAYAIDLHALEKLPAIIPIGRPLLNQGVYILDSQMRLRPQGAWGELYISGCNVGRGYLNEVDKTAERFIEHPYYPGIRLYRTGDMARWLFDGQIEYFGRKDFQVKVNGYRIELGDIEQALLSHPQIKAAIAIVYHPPESLHSSEITSQTGYEGKLALYYTSEPRLEEAEAQRYVMDRVPSYMIPAYFLFVDQFPLTPNGKIDRKQLPPPAIRMKSLEDRDEYDGLPTTQWELAIADVWTKVLGERSWSVHDSFFQEGGDSLKALRIMMELEGMGIHVKLHDIFKYQTIRSLAERWSSIAALSLSVSNVPLATNNNLNEREQQPRKDWHDFSKRILSKAVEEVTAYRDGWLRQPTIGRFEVSAIQRAFLASDAAYSGVVLPIHAALESEQIREGVSLVIRDHALLRSELSMTGGGEWEWSEYEWTADLAVPFLDITECSLSEQALVMQELITELYYAPYEVIGRPLYRLLLVKLNIREYRLVLPCHHAIYDGMSGDILERAVMDKLLVHSLPSPTRQQPIFHYRDFVSQIKRGPQISEPELITNFRLETYHHASKQLYDWLQRYEEQPTRQYRIEVPFEQYYDKLKAEQLFSLCLNMVEQFGSMYRLPSPLPLLMFHYGRRYEQSSFYDTIGPFIDLLPMVLEQGTSEPSAQISEYMRKAADTNVNFISFVFDERIQEEFPRAAELIHPSAHTGILFNYHGQVEHDKILLFNGLVNPIEKEQKKRVNGGIVLDLVTIDIMYSEQVLRLSLTCPFEVSEKELTLQIEGILASSVLVTVEN